MPTIFTRIITGELPSHMLYRDDVCVAFLSINPIRPGHTLVVPIVEVDHWLDLDDPTAAHLTMVAKRIGAAQQAAFRPRRIGMMIAGFEVPHVHLHVLPIDDLGDLSFAHAEASPDPAALASAAERIRTALAELGAAPPD